MGRPLKIGLDYFPLDVSIDDDVELLEAECGLSGFAILIKLWQKIYSKGYYIEWGEDNALLFSRKINSGINEVDSVINASFRRNLLDKTMYKKHGILTSTGIQRRYFKACADCKRKNIPAISQYLLLTTEETKLITEFIELNQEESTQKKGEKIDSKEEDTKEIKLLSESDSDDSLTKQVKEVVSYLNEKANKKYRHSATGTKKWIEARLNEDFSLEDLKHVVDVKCAEWLGTDNEKYLRPETLFGNKCDGYRNQPMPSKKKQQPQKTNSFDNFEGRMGSYSPDEIESKYWAKHGRKK